MPDRLVFRELDALARRAATVRVQAGLDDLARIAEFLPGQTDTLDCTLAFEPDAGSSVRVTGQLGCRVNLVCQRCLEPMTLPVDAAMDVRLVRAGAEGGDGDTDTDSVAVPDDGLALVDLLEDELLLALPGVPRHPDRSDCGELASKVAKLRQPEGALETQRPFEILKSLRAGDDEPGDEDRKLE